jgi:hypothetical protein
MVTESFSRASEAGKEKVKEKSIGQGKEVTSLASPSNPSQNGALEPTPTQNGREDLKNE